MTKELQESRRVVQRPTNQEAGLAVVCGKKKYPSDTRYKILQLWESGNGYETDPVYIGDREDAIELIAALTDVVSND